MNAYKLMHRPRGMNDNSHFVWRREGDGAVVISDWSGPTPDKTDDGPLLVRPGAAVEAHLRDWGVLYTLDVFVEARGEPGRVMTGYETILAVLRQGAKLDVALHPALRREVEALGAIQGACLTARRV